MASLDAILPTRQLVVEQAGQVLGALRVFDSGKASFADCLIARLAVNAGWTETMTFDVAAAKYAGMTLVR